MGRKKHTAEEIIGKLREAEIVQALKADEQIARGDVDGERIWKRIGAAILVLASEPPPDAVRH